MKVFVSYSRADEKLAAEVCSRLELDGHELWRDVSSIPGGADWSAAIEQGIRAADTFLILMSPNVVRSPNYARDELGFARKHDKTILPVYLKPVKKLPDGFELTLSGIEHIELFPSFEAGMDELAEVLGSAAVSATEDDVPGLRVWARDRYGKLRTGARKLRVEARQRELGKKALQVGGALAAAAGAAAVAAAKTKAEAEAAAAEREHAAAASAMELYRSKLTEHIIDFVNYYSDAGDVTAAAYADELRPRLWHLLGQVKATPPPPQLAQQHNDFSQKLNDSLSNLDDAYRGISEGELERANRAARRSIENLIKSMNSYVALLDGSS